MLNPSLFISQEKNNSYMYVIFEALVRDMRQLGLFLKVCFKTSRHHWKPFIGRKSSDKL